MKLQLFVSPFELAINVHYLMEMSLLLSANKFSFRYYMLSVCFGCGRIFIMFLFVSPPLGAKYYFL